jgi:hypothetical protein
LGPCRTSSSGGSSPGRSCAKALGSRDEIGRANAAFDVVCNLFELRFEKDLQEAQAMAEHLLELPWQRVVLPWDLQFDKVLQGRFSGNL